VSTLVEVDPAAVVERQPPRDTDRQRDGLLDRRLPEERKRWDPVACRVVHRQHLRGIAGWIDGDMKHRGHGRQRRCGVTGLPPPLRHDASVVEAGAHSALDM
jgi:hypothetical protein